MSAGASPPGEESHDGRRKSPAPGVGGHWIAGRACLRAWHCAQTLSTQNEMDSWWGDGEEGRASTYGGISRRRGMEGRARTPGSAKSTAGGSSAWRFTPRALRPEASAPTILAASTGPTARSDLRQGAVNTTAWARREVEGLGGGGDTGATWRRSGVWTGRRPGRGRSGASHPAPKIRPLEELRALQVPRAVDGRPRLPSAVHQLQSTGAERGDCEAP